MSGASGWAWHAGSGAVVWQLMFPADGLVAGLKRRPSLREASLFCLDAATGEALCDDFVVTSGPDGLPVGDGWMVGLEAAGEGLLFVHGFQEGSPEHQGIWAVDPSRGAIVWSRPEAVFAAYADDALLVYRNRMFAGFPEREYWLIDPRTGEVVESLGTGHERPNELRMHAPGEAERQGIRLAESRPSLAGPVESIESGALLVEGRHEPSLLPGAWRSTLRAVVGGVVIHEGVMAASAPAPVCNNFLTRMGRLYYIKENEQLISVDLT